MKYSLTMRVLHWLMALLLIGMIASGLLIGELPDEIKFKLIPLHKSFGVTLLGLALIRLAVRFCSVIPPLPETIKAMERLAAKAGHWGFYALMIAMPVSGYVMSNGKGYGVDWFGVPLPLVTEKNPPLGETAAEAHEILGYIFIALIILHVLGVIKHALADKTNLLLRMR